MGKYTKVFVSACAVAVILSFTSTGQTIELNRVPLIQTPKQFVEHRWSYVNSAGNTTGPVTLTDLRQLYKNGPINDSTYLWNGTTVTQWTPLSQLPDLLKQLKGPRKPFRIR